MQDVTVDYSVTDDETPAEDITCSLSVTSNEPEKGVGDGDTAPDWEIIDAHHVRLRAERSGEGTGRIYTITITCTDASGNTSTKNALVVVPLEREDTEAAAFITGTVTLKDCPNASVPMTFIFHPLDNSGDITRTVTPNADGTFLLLNLPANNYQLRVKSSNTLAQIVPADASSGSVTCLNIGPLKGGDANDDNVVDQLDFSKLIASFDADPSSDNWLDGVADFNCDDIVDVNDLSIFIQNFDASGDEF
jgi:hypothetical protein